MSLKVAFTSITLKNKQNNNWIPPFLVKQKKVIEYCIYLNVNAILH